MRVANEILMYFRSNNKNSRNISLNDAIGYDKDGNEISIVDVLKIENTDFLDDISLRDDIKLVRKYFSVLNDREKQILTMRYGLNNNDALTQKVIAKRLNISRSYVSRIEKRALTKILREFIRNEKVDKG